MRVRWKTLLIQGSIWLASEVLLTLVGLDDLADYSEFVFEKYLIDSSPPIVSIV
ncbi:MAG TPA: hypothetical protein IGS17_04505 [Oscillatoriales cyanobacterium M59_W2019_021]|nr:hypothetical protein [Oscillatoriales cyanobacterium M4454_W2019_049]HIK50178.1 hypothetical protein [Oscillatoriales cyanobacterium M59_W2019_021]